ncbi:DUF4157 domain-containing protein [Spirosoma sp. BT702]|uniref:DUF4157 domain-containing protein n=1 Tax=Spirosoma profusum TaxID=2771354 RepID=A0A926XUN3_9BACT|nr:DUF4157 domain-containing protein [Spirosoma profusum]MBD2700763.1 DUF4157 domain-containing protein [Spirosoma profusum]
MEIGTKKSAKALSRLPASGQKGPFLGSPTESSPDVFFPKALVQPKLEISQPGDAFEQEADATANHVMRMAQPAAGNDGSGGGDDNHVAPASNGVDVMPKCAACEEEEKQEQPEVQAKEQPSYSFDWSTIMRAPIDEEEDRPNIIQAKERSDQTHLMLKCSHCEAEERSENAIQRKANENDTSGGSGFSLESYLQRSTTSGQPMDRDTATFMESRFGADFSSVRIHNDTSAGQASDSIRARAFTHGQNIHFNQGEYQPQTDSGRWLLAHELTHTLQQSTGAVQPKINVSRMGSAQPMRKAKPDEPAYHEFLMGGRKAYEAAKAANLDSWYDGYKFFNLFEEEGIYPGSHPNAYATRVYELQEKLHELINDEKKYPAENITGMLEPDFSNSATLNALLAVADKYVKDGGNSQVDAIGLGADMLKRVNRLITSIDPKAPPLESRLFQGIKQLNMVNSSASFTIGKGDQGFYVAVIQSALLQLNYTLGADYRLVKGDQEKTVTGIFGDDTLKAVEQFQMDSGLEGKDIDGVVGQITLRLIDRRLEKYVRTSHSYYDANSIGFTVAVTKEDIPSDPSKAEEIKHNMLIRTIMAAMPLTKSEAENLLTSGWHWLSYRDVTVDDVAKGYIVNSITKESYEKIMGKPKGSTGGITEEHLSEQIIDQALSLQAMGALYQLQKEVKALEKQRDSFKDLVIQSEGYTSTMLSEQLASVEEQLKAKVEARDKELNRLGFKSIDEFTNKQDQFVKTFLQYAAMIAFKMLGQNEAKASVESQHYENIDEIRKLKEAITLLNTYYANAETYLMQGFSYVQTDGKDANKYKTRWDYVMANQHCDEGGCDGAIYEAQIQSAWQASVKEKSTKNPYYAKLFDEEATAFKYLKDKSEVFPILGNPKFNVREKGPNYAKKTNESLRDEVREIIGTRTSDDGVLHNIAATRERIRGNVELIWEMPPVIALAKAELGIIEGTVLDNIIMDAYKAHKDEGFWKTIFKAALGIGLGLLALVSGPVGWVALGASIAYGAYEAYETFQDIKFRREASETAIDEENMALMHDKPSYFWFVVSLVGVGLDVVQAARLVKAAKVGIELSKGVQESINAEIAASKLRQTALKAGSKEAVDIGRRIERLEKALTEIDWVHYAEHSKILTVLKDSPFAVRFMADALKEPGLAKAFTRLAKLNLSEDLMKTVVGMYAGVGKKAIGELPELMRLIESGKLAGNSALTQTILTDLKVQKALLDSGDPAKIAKLFGEWEATSAGKALSFADHLKASGLNTFFQKGVVLTERYGAEFAQMGNLLKNKLILREIEPLLVEALNAKRLPPSVQRSLEVTLQRDVLGLTNDLGIAQERMAKQISALGETLQFQHEYLAVSSLLQNAQSRKLLWDAAVNLPGRADYLKIMEEVTKANPEKMGKIMDDLIKIGPITDKSTLEKLIADDVLRKALADNPLAVLALKKCASPCFPPNVTPEQIKFLTKLMTGKSNDEIAKINNLIYQSRGSEEKLEAAIKSLDSNFDDAIKAVKTVDVVFPKGLNVTDQMRSSASVLVNMGLPSDQVSNIIRNVVAQGGASSTRVENLLDSMSRMLKLNNLNKILTGLESSDKSLFKTAEFLVDEIVSHTNPSELDKLLGVLKYPGLHKTDVLLNHFTLNELRDIRLINRDQVEFVSNLFFVTQKVKGTKAEWISLAKQAGTSAQADLPRLIQILEGHTGTMTMQEALDAIARSKSFADDVAKAMANSANGYQATAQKVWDITDTLAKDAPITLPDKFLKGADGAGSAAYAQVIKKGRGIALADGTLAGKTVDYTRWKVLISTIENTAVSRSIKNLIRGELWTLVHMRWLEANGYKVFREVKIFDGIRYAKADLVAVKDGEMLIIEMKSIAGKLTSNQESIYPLLQDPTLRKQLKFFENPEVDALFAKDPSKAVYQLLEEQKLVPQ